MAFIPGNKSKEVSFEEVRPIYLNTTYSFEERAADLVSRMTLEEKQSLLGNTMPAIPRLGINAYQVWGEALHGVAGFINPNVKEATSFPSSASLGSSWDPLLMQREACVISEEARGFNSKVISNLTYWSPVVEPVRDPRWGRTGESYGEDPFLISQIAGGFIRGLMGNDPTYLKAVPTGKHYFANNSEFNRHTSSSNMDDRDMREFYLAPYKKLIEKDNLPSIMTCYNAVNGVPVTASKFLVDTIARRTYGLSGYVTSDCGGVTDIQTGHFYAKSNAEAASMGLKAGVDTDCGSVYQTGTIDAFKSGLISAAGNITGGNLNATGLSLSGNVVSAINTVANITTTANIAGGFFIGNGSQLTGLPAGYSNAEVSAYLASGTDAANIITTANISGGYLSFTGAFAPATGGGSGNVDRSEERREGKGCLAAWSG